jgi:ParB family chromosome partitioning protein
MPKQLQKPKLKNIDDIFQLGEIQGITQVQLSELVPFHNHPFRLYDNERLEDMVASIKANGVLVPIIVRRKDGGILEILAGHNRVEASKQAGLAEISAMVLDDISDEVAMAYVVETNLIQRSFSEMAHSEKAAVIAMHHSKMFSQGKRNDILSHLKAFETIDNDNSTSSHSETKLRSDEKVGETYNLSRATVARYLRINQLVRMLKILLDDGVLPFLAAVEVSFLPEQVQHILADCLEDGFSFDNKKATLLREYCKENTLDRHGMEQLLLGEKKPKTEKPRRISVRGEVYSRYFTDQTPQEVESIVEEALAMYFAGR